MAVKKQVQKYLLIVEDEPALLDVLCKKMSELDCTVITATDGQEAIELIERQHPSVVLLDIVMPRKNGFDVLKEMRLNLHDNNPVIIISNLERQEDVETGKNYGVKDYVIKSNISMRQLVTMVSSALQEPPQVVPQGAAA